VSPVANHNAVQVIAHRGCAAQFPENTITAVRAVAPHVDMVELDVRQCASGEVVVVHDDHLGQLAGVDRRVSETDWSTLRSLTVLDSGESIPRLSTVFEALPADTGVNIELKTADAASAVLEIAAADSHRTLFSSFDPAALATLQDEAPESARALLVPPPETAVETAASGTVVADTVAAVLDRADALGCEAVHPQYDWCLQTRLVERAHDRGLAVNAWTFDAADPIDACIDAGVDGVIVDRYDLV